MSDQTEPTIVRTPVIDAMETCRAMRYLKPDPVPDELIETVLYAATRASSPHNSQGWLFIVVRDAEKRRRLGELYGRIHLKVLDGMDVEQKSDPSQKRTVAGAQTLDRTLADVPVLIFVCIRDIFRVETFDAFGQQGDLTPSQRVSWSTGYCAAQNLIVAARSLGLGTVFTSYHILAEPETHEILALPENVRIAVTIPMGWPRRSFGPVSRHPLADVVRYDSY